MKCSRRSTTSRGSVGAALVALALIARPVVAHAAVDEAAVRSAIEAALAAKLGSDARIVVRDLTVRTDEGAAGSVFATLPADARAGAPVRVVLKVQGRDRHVVRFGEAFCTIDVVTRGWRSTRAIRRGTVLTASDGTLEDVNLAGSRLRALPSPVEGALVLADVAAGELFESTTIRPTAIVRSGDEVTVTVTTGNLQVQGRAVAAQAGRLGEIIRVVNPETGRHMAARVTGPAAVEVRHGS